MPNALTNTNISATYKGVLHANGEPIPDVGLKPVYDGTGVQSALSIGRADQGATVTGFLSSNDLRAGQLKMPNVDRGIVNHVVARTTAGVLELKALSEIIGASTIADGVYDNPRITVVGNVITKIESRPTIQLLTTPVNLISYVGNKPATTFTESFTIEWKLKNGYYADAPTNTISPRYAIITVKMYIESNSRNFTTEMLKDSIQIAQATIGANDTDYQERLDRNKYVYVSQVIVNIPQNEVSLFEYKSLYNQTTTGDKFPSRQNISGRSVTLDGWVY